MSAWAQPQSIFAPVESQAVVIADALDRLAYFFLWAFICCASWGESISVGGGLFLANGLGLLAIGVAALRAVVTRQVRRLCPLHYWMAAWVSWSILSILWTVDWDSSVTRAEPP